MNEEENNNPASTGTVDEQASTGNETNSGAADKGTGSDKDKETPKTFTQEEVDAAVKDRLAREQKKIDEKVNAQVEQKLKETKRLSELSDAERETEQRTQWEKDLQEREAKIQRAELLGETESVLREKKLPTTFAPFLVSQDAESTLVNVNAFKVAFADSVKAEVKAALSGKTPDKKGTSDTELTKEKINAVKNAAERHKLIKENPDLFQK